jgi:hypothetical protein
MARASSSVFKGSELPGRTGRPASFIARRASTLSPIMRMTEGRGPMNLMLHASQISAK